MANDEIIENLKKLSNAHRSKIDEIETKIRIIDVIPKAKALIGRCFKYPSSYSFGMTKRGMVYQRVVGITPHGDILIDGFNTDGPNKVEFVFNRHDYIGHFQHQSVTEIKEKEYFKAFDKMIKLIVKAAKRK